MTVTLCVIARQILLDDIALDGQQKLLDSQVLIIGTSGRAGYTCCAVPGGRWRGDAAADDDDVHLSNLQRQILFTTEDIDPRNRRSANSD